MLPRGGLESEDAEDAGYGDDQEAGGAGAGHHGTASFRLCFGFRAFLLLSLNSFGFLQPVNVGSGINKEGFVEILKI